MKKTIYLSPERRPAPHGKYWGMNIYEHDVCCEISEMMKPLLEGSGFSVIIANPTDTIEKRVAQANNLRVDYYLPIHTNASGNGMTPGTATGCECLYYGNVGGASYKANQLVYNELVKLYPSKRGLKNGNAYYENKYTNLIVQYAHQVFAITGGSVGISVDIFEREAEVNVSVDVSSAYDTSPQRPHKFLY